MTQPAPLNYERVAARFQQRFAESTAKYEADIIILQEQYEARIAELQERIQELEGDSSDVVATEGD